MPSKSHASSDFTPAHTPVEFDGERRIWLKRDDLYCFAGVRGGKVRSCRRLAQGATALVTASSRHSPQMTIVARIAQRMNIPAVLHMACGPDTDEMLEARTVGAAFIRHKPGYNSVIIARAKRDAVRIEAKEIPFGMKCIEAVEETSKQVFNLPTADQIRRIVLPVGSGISLAGVLLGIEQIRQDLKDTPVVGIQVGADPTSTLDAVAPFGWRRRCQILLAHEPYHVELPGARLGNVAVDPHYEAKVLGFLRPGDLFWVVGIRRSSDINA